MPATTRSVAAGKNIPFVLPSTTRWLARVEKFVYFDVLLPDLNSRQKAYAYFLFQNSEYNSLPQAVEITLSVDFDLANRPVTECVNSSI